MEEISAANLPEEYQITDKREFELSVIARIIQSWIDWNFEQREKEGLSTSSSTHVMRVPVWPTIGILQQWVKALKQHPNLENSTGARCVCPLCNQPHDTKEK